MPLTAGPHAIGATFAGRAEVENTRRLQAILRTTSDTSETLIGPPHVLTVTVTGPFNPAGPGTRRAGAPSSPAVRSTPRRKSRAPARSSRRWPAAPTAAMQTPADVNELIGHFREWRPRQAASTRPSGSRCSASSPDPKFLVRTERDARGRGPGTVYRVTDLELASRLSFFLWSSLPDDELLDLAARRAG